MPTQGTISPNVISSILLALRRMSPSSPKHVLSYLNNPKPPHDYNFLDAFATLCSFVPHCESASAVIQRGSLSDSLYIATNPSAPPTVRTLINALIHALPIPDGTGGRGPSSSPKMTDSVTHTDTAIHCFIVQVYRSCHEKILDAVDPDDHALLSDNLSTMSAGELRFRGIEEKKNSLVDSLNSIMNSKGRDPSTFSDNDFFHLHQVAQTIGEFRDTFTAYPFVLEADRISRAVNTIITWATSRENKNLDVIFIEPPCVPDFLATTNMCEFRTGVEKALYDDISRDWMHFEPSEDVSEVEGRPNHFTGHGVVHCESALLHYIFGKDISIHPYIGCSHPICYACLMLVRAYSWAIRKPVAIGRRSVDLEELDVAWSYPPMGLGIYKRLERTLTEDFKRFCLHADGRHHRYVESIVDDRRDLPMLARYLDFVNARGGEVNTQSVSE